MRKIYLAMNGHSHNWGWWLINRFTWMTIMVAKWFSVHFNHWLADGNSSGHEPIQCYLAIIKRKLWQGGGSYNSLKWYNMKNWTIKKTQKKKLSCLKISFFSTQWLFITADHHLPSIWDSVLGILSISLLTKPIAKMLIPSSKQEYHSSYL